MRRNRHQFILGIPSGFCYASPVMPFVPNKSFAAVLVSLLAVLGMAGVQAKEVTLRNKDGKSLSARLITCDGDKLTVLRSSDKKQFELSMAQLDDASRAEVDAWLAAGGGLSERYEIDVSSGRRQRSTGYDYDEDKKFNMEPTIVIKNPLPNIRTRAAKVTTLILGRPVSERNAYHVFSVESFDLPSLEGGKEGVLQMKRISHVFDDRGSYRYGARYLGWVVVIQDVEDGRVIMTQSLPQTLSEKYGRKFLTLKAGTTYDDKLRVLEDVNIDY